MKELSCKVSPCSRGRSQHRKTGASVQASRDENRVRNQSFDLKMWAFSHTTHSLQKCNFPLILPTNNKNVKSFYILYITVYSRVYTYTVCWSISVYTHSHSSRPNDHHLKKNRISSIFIC